MGGNQLSLPILYKANETDFTHMGLGVLIDTVEAKVIEERNGLFEMEMVYPTQSELYKEIKVDRLIKVDANPTLPDQRFKIIKITSESKGMAKVYAEHVSYLTQDLQLEPEVHYFGSAREALATWADNIVDTHPFTTDSDIQTLGEGTWRVEELDSARRALGGVRGSMLDSYGGEYRFDNYHIELLNARGNNDTLLIAYGRNLTKLEQDEEIANTFTSVYPYARFTPEREPGSGDEVEEVLITLPERYLDSRYVNDYARRKILTLDMTDDSIKTVEQLRRATERYIEDNGVGIPKVNLRVEYQDLAQTLDYKDLQILEHIDLTDHVLIDFEDFGIERKAKIIKVVWDVLMERYDQLEIGEARASLSDTIRHEVDGRLEAVEIILDNVRASADGKSKNYSGVNEPIGDLNEGDIWLKPIGDKDTEMYIYKNGVWSFRLSTAKMTEVSDKVDKAVQDVESALTNTNEIVAEISGAVEGSGFVNLGDLLASKIGDEDASSLFFQKAKEIGLAYEENGEIKAMIGIVDGKVIQSGQQIFLNADEIIANGTLTITEDMFAQGISFDWAIGQTLDASKIRVINLDFDSMSGGDIELNRGFRITHGGQNVLSVDAQTGRIVFDIPGVITEDELQNAIDGVELKPGPSGKTAYEVALDNGFRGTEAEWIESLAGKEGQSGKTAYELAVEQGFRGTMNDWLNSLEGEAGLPGQGIESIKNYYYLSTSKTEQVDGVWEETPQEWEYGKYLWTKSTITYKNPTEVVDTLPMVSAEWEAVNQLEIDGRNLIPSFKNDTWYLNPDYKEVAVDGGEEVQQMVRLSFVRVLSPYELYMADDADFAGEILINASRNTDYTLSVHAVGGMMKVECLNIIVDETTGEESESIRSTHSAIKNSPFTFNTGQADMIKVSMIRETYDDGSRRGGSAHFRRIKLEKQPKASAWSPAPEDMGIDAETIDKLGKDLSEQGTTVKENELAIQEAVMNLAGVNKDLDALVNLNIEDQLLGITSNLQKFSFSDEGLVIRPNTDDSATKIVMNSFGIYFYNGSQDDFGNEVPVASIEEQELKINKGIFMENLKIAGHSFEEGAPGHTEITWTGAGN